ncbi:hypothetical protein CQW23_14392 [Capsicum baccatum]|uniref:Uncharacterized protein n=1 Tax=Capsicum baccatum TaxID=33114 RepID=A0A2G2WJ19_CAPBA|nr:hypothetical protein CQW23_14392 [Capsicum baccatum]
MEDGGKVVKHSKYKSLVKVNDKIGNLKARAYDDQRKVNCHKTIVLDGSLNLSCHQEGRAGERFAKGITKRGCSRNSMTMRDALLICQSFLDLRDNFRRVVDPTLQSNAKVLAEALKLDLSSQS